MLSRTLIEEGLPKALEEARDLQGQAEGLILGLCDKYSIKTPPKEDRHETWYDTFVIAWHR